MVEEVMVGVGWAAVASLCFELLSATHLPLPRLALVMGATLLATTAITVATATTTVSALAAAALALAPSALRPRPGGQ